MLLRLLGSGERERERERERVEVFNADSLLVFCLAFEADRRVWEKERERERIF